MSDSGVEDQEHYLGHVTKKGEYIKIECLSGNTVSIITANLHDASIHDAVNCSAVARWFNYFKKGGEIDGR